MLDVENLTVAFGGVRALRDISFAVEPGEIFGIIGPNGAGKTTLLNTISSLKRPKAGDIRLDGRSIVGLRPHELARRGVARTFQIVQPFFRMSVRENVATGAMFGCESSRPGASVADIVETALKRSGLMSKADILPPQLTLAERKRLELARALAMRPRILLLDEVMAGLNHTEIDRVIGLVRELNGDGITVIVIEHVMKAVVALCSRLLVLNFGAKLAEGRPAEVLVDPAVLEAYLGRRYAQGRQAEPAS